ncbi:MULTISPECIES: hypothetical protein [Brevibacterium]|uniref:Aminoglycoside phosphotransferase domain-containing protein n=1 Tax=Brevibacterium casei TaxID=33889 RepID=A0A7T3ZZM3_9MICO|nr:hypothetical protein [Brevibacterium casei]QQB14640.1 hypothetical protein I6H47_01170 [Brevibacterium casei]
MTAVDAALAAAGAATPTARAVSAAASVDGATSGDASSAIGIPFLDDLREATALSRLLGFAARPVRLRVKLGRSAIVAWRRDGVPGLAGWGWTTVVSDADKLANLRRRADRRGQPLHVHAIVTDRGASAGHDTASAAHDAASAQERPAEAREFTLVSGGVLADPKLGASLARVRGDLDLEACTVVGYNPARRLLLEHAGEFVRIGTDPYDRLLAAAEHWQRNGLPTLPVTRLGADATAVRSPWWGNGDLAGHPDAQIAEAVGRTIAVLHGRTIADSDDRTVAMVDRRTVADVDRAGAPNADALTVGDACAMLDDTVGTLSQLLPFAEVERAGRLARTIAAELSSTDRSRALTELSDIHGDLSPDQILVDGGEFRMIDLDRAGVGPIGMDLGRWIAACRLRGDTAGQGLETGFLRGYGTVTSYPTTGAVSHAAPGTESDAARGTGTAESEDAAAASSAATSLTANPPRIAGAGVWAAWALLLTAVEPWRTCRPAWREHTERHLDLAEEALEDRPRPAHRARRSLSASPVAPGYSRSTRSARAGSAPIPATIRIDGTEVDIRRAWPAKKGRIAFEATTADGIRAGFLDPTPRDTPRGDPREPAHAGDTRELSPVGTRTTVPPTPAVTLLPAGTDPDLPGLARLLDGPTASGNRLVSHRPGRRAVVALADGTFAKCVRHGKAAAILAGQDRALAFTAGFTLPRVLDADDATVHLSRVPGVELHDPRALGVNWERAWTDCLGAWDRADARALPDSTPTHTAGDEAGVLDEWRDRSDGLLGGLASRLDPLLDEVTARLRDSAGTLRWGPVHRDLHDKQLMWDAVEGPGLLDVDTACRGERELDLGNLSAHATWRRAQGIWSPAEAEAVTRAIAGVTSAGGYDRSRLRLYERASLLRLVCVYAFRPRWAARTGALLDAAAE